VDALDYARKHELHALVLERNGTIEVEVYDGGYDAEKSHPLYSGTKSFWGVCAVLAQSEGLLSLDDRVCDTIAEWRDDAAKSAVTLRMLLDLTSGFGFGGLGSAVPSYAAALAMPLRARPGSRFTYGGIPLQVFGAVLARKLASRELTPHEYLSQTVLEPSGSIVASWKTMPDGTKPLPTGAAMNARSWLGYGRWVMQRQRLLSACFLGSSANRHYGLGWRLGAKTAPPDLFYASGSGGQGLYVVPSQALVAVHFGRSSSFKHEIFLRRLFTERSA
jgi:CubicO group peptidase (beta-lactamase class C family)